MKKKPTPPLIKHRDHEVVILLSNNLKHAAKYHCITCNKFVAWLSREDAIEAERLGLINDLDLSAQQY